jgi:hypothetical protein
MPTIFDRLARGRPPKPKIEQPSQEPAQLLLNWLARRTGNTVTARDIRNYGPGSIRNREIALNSAKVLAAHGFLTPINSHTWKINRDPLVASSS